MRVLKLTLKSFLLLLGIILCYLIIALVFSKITISKRNTDAPLFTSIFLKTNGVHLDLALPKDKMNDELLKGILEVEKTNYIAFGWGDENFYINTPTWADLTFSNAFSALFLNNSSLIHITKYYQPRKKWIEIPVSKEEFQKLENYLLSHFIIDKNGQKILLEDKSYTSNDDFYKAKGSYSCFKTCNTWINTGFKTAGLKSSYWTPFDFGLLHKY